MGLAVVNLLALALMLLATTSSGLLDKVKATVVPGQHGFEGKELNEGKTLMHRTLHIQKKKSNYHPVS
jgi:hypothetical protein